METTLDVAGLPEDRIQYLKNLVAIWKARGENSSGLQPIIKRKVARILAMNNRYVAC